MTKKVSKRLSPKAVEEIKATILGEGVGYRRPPEATRFRKGKSGNPKGRPQVPKLPAGRRPATELTLKEAGRLIRIKEGDSVREIPAIEAVYRAQYATAAKGNAYAQKHIIEQHARAVAADQERTAKSNEYWLQYIVEAREKEKEAKRNGQPPPVLLPHPDDIVLDVDLGPRFIGPIDEEEAERLDETLRLRDLLLLQDELDERRIIVPPGGDPDDGPGTAGALAMALNDYGVPPRFRWTNDVLAMKMMRLHAKPTRELLKELYQGWRAMGHPRPRGWTTPPRRFARQAFNLLGEALDLVRGNEKAEDE